MSEAAGLRQALTGLLSGYIAPSDEFGYAKLAPFRQCDALTGEYLTLTSTTLSDGTGFRKSAAGGQRVLENLAYAPVSVTLDTWQSNVVPLQDLVVQLFNSGGSVDLLDHAAKRLGQHVRVAIAQAIETLVTALSAGTSIALTTAATNIAASLRGDMTTIKRASGQTPDTFAISRTYADKFWLNTDLRAQASIAHAGYTPGTFSGILQDQSLKAWFMSALGLDLVILDQDYDSAGTATAVTTTQAFLGKCNGEITTFALFGPRAASSVGEVFPVQTERLGVMEGGPGTGSFVDAAFKIQAQMASTGRKITVS